ncbi:DUF6940 family protein [Fodinibius sediminis]|uniref:Uncharacterized protein n=1 Tax=Fodinibius sediminis TaxID=1214077 RepID=A0A521F2X2_9BACT|nr:hypothetical protein [Fodinibius sediminis]SMO90529.1 hypothetical protein SAMN06265218_12241 [Fodinibius sediminis]
MWNIDRLTSSSYHIKFRIYDEESVITNQYFLELLFKSSNFRRFYNTFLADSPFEAFLWENRPMTLHNLDRPYECNLVNSKPLAERKADHLTFSSYFDHKKAVVTFPNLGGDALLIVPCPLKKFSVYPHIGAFIRKADNHQIDAFWQKTAKQMLDRIAPTPRWLSTSGLGVSWTHARIDSRPKYYQSREYKMISR